MAQDSTQKAGRAMIEALSDSRYSPTALVNMICEHADSNDTAQINMYNTMVSYAYNRQMMWDWGTAYGPAKTYVGSRCSDIVHDVIDLELKQALTPDTHKGTSFDVVPDLTEHDG